MMSCCASYQNEIKATNYKKAFNQETLSRMTNMFVAQEGLTRTYGTDISILTRLIEEGRL